MSILGGNMSILGDNMYILGDNSLFHVLICPF